MARTTIRKLFWPTIAIGLIAISRLSRARAQRRRSSEPAETGFMLAMHNAFRRDMDRLAGVSGPISPNVIAGWEIFRKQLEIHHEAEDNELWPKLRSKVPDGEIDDIVEEHAAIPPALTAVSEALATEQLLETAIDDLIKLVKHHLEHEETAVLPLVEKELTAEDWQQWLRTERAKRSPQERATFLSWVLDEANPQDTRVVLQELPPPARFVYRRFMGPAWERRNLWQDDVEPIF